MHYWVRGLVAVVCGLQLTLLLGCSRTVGAVNPRPTVVIEEGMGQLALDLTTVPDTQSPADGLTIIEFRKTLENGFRNMAGANLARSAQDAALTLRIEQAELGRGNIGNLGGYVTIRYRAAWLGPNGQKIAALAGMAEPRNPTETGPRHMEDVVEVMYQQIVAGLEKVQGVKTRESENQAPATAE